MSNFLSSIDWAIDDGINLPMINDFMRNQFYDNVLRNRVNNKHCGPFSYPVVLKNIQNSTITLSHHTKTGELKYT